MSEDFILSPGALFEVTWRRTTDDCQTFKGRYKGLCAVASDTALVFEVGDVTRLVSSSAIVCMDQLESAPVQSSTSKKADPGNVFYG